MKTDRRFARTNLEALCSVGLTILFAVWWYAFAYGLGDRDPSTYTKTFGIPDWFFYSSVVGPFLFCILAWLMVHFIFKDIPLSPHDKGDARTEGGENHDA